MLRFSCSTFIGRAISAFGFMVLLVTHLSNPLFAQNLTSTASISGIVADPGGARIADAVVTISSPQRGISRTFKTDSSGAFSFNLLLPTTYSLKVEASGFQTYDQAGITLEVGQSARLSVVLPVGNVSQRVQVSAEAPLLTTDNANLGSEVTGKQIVELPLNFRSPIGLAFLDSSVRNMNQGSGGAGQDTADQDMSFLSFGGQPFATTGYLLDGSYNGAMGWDGVIYVPSVDSVQEFKIQTNSFTAQYGLSAGNVINVITKSGSSEFHGDLYEFFRNNALDANYYFNFGKPKTPLHMNQFGISEGGPLYIPGIYKRRDRTFFFGLYEGLRLIAPVTYPLNTTPTNAFKSGDLSGLLGSPIGIDALCRPIRAGQVYNPQSYTTAAICPVAATSNSPAITPGQSIVIRDPIANNNLSSMIDPAAAKLLPFFPDPTASGIRGNFAKSQSAATNSNEFTVRIDHSLTSSARLYGRFSRKWESKEQSPSFYGLNNPAGPGQINPNNRYSIALGYNQVLTPTFIASFNFGFQRWVEGNVAQGYPFKPSSLGLPGGLDSLTPVFPNITINGYTQLGSATQQAFSNNTGSISTDLVKTIGPHTLSFGYMGVLNQLNGGQVQPTYFTFTQGFTSGPDPSHATPGTGDSFASFLLGTPASGSATVTFLPQVSKHSHGLYVQDDWKANSRLTLNLGIRYDLQLAPIDRNNSQAYFNPDVVNPISGPLGKTYLGALVYNDQNNRGNYRNDYNNFSPRFGFAFLITKNLVTRGGFATFYPVAFLGNPANPGYSRTTSYNASNNGGLNPASTLSNPFPAGILQPVGNSLGSLVNLGQNVGGTLNYNRKSPYVEQWSLGLQYSFSSKDVLDTTYVGNHGIHLISSSGINLNQLPPEKLALGNAALTAQVPNPFYGQPAMTGSPCQLANATVPAYQLMLPFPQYCSTVTSAKAAVGASNYNALQMRYTHRAANGVVLSANYTYAKFIDDVPGAVGFVLTYPYTVRNSYNLGAERSVDVGDIPHAAVISGIFPLPLGKGKKFGSNFHGITEAVLGGWQVSTINTFRQGTPMSINANVNPASTFGGNQHAVLVGDPNKPGPVAGNSSCLNYPAKVKTVQNWFNPCAFVTAAAGTFGNVPNYLPYLRTPGYADTDLAISKWFIPVESVHIQFRTEMFNAFNHPNFGGPNGSGIVLGSATFSTISRGDIARQIQLALKAYW